MIVPATGNPIFARECLHDHPYCPDWILDIAKRSFSMRPYHWSPKPIHNHHLWVWKLDGKKLMGKILICLKYAATRNLNWYPGLPERRTCGCYSKSRLNILWAHCEKARFSGTDKKDGKICGQQEKTVYPVFLAIEIWLPVRRAHHPALWVGQEQTTKQEP